MVNKDIFVKSHKIPNMSLDDIIENIRNEQGNEGYILEFFDSEYNTHLVKVKNIWYVNLHQIKYLQGWIANDNIGSIKNFLKNGYYKTDETKIVKFGDGSDKLFEKYMIDIR